MQGIKIKSLLVSIITQYLDCIIISVNIGLSESLEDEKVLCRLSSFELG